MANPAGDTASEEPTPSREDEPGARRLRAVVEWVVVVAVALGAALLVKTFILGTFYIPSASMEPTLMVGDRVFVNKLSYDVHSIHRGDVVVFTLPPGESAGPGIDDLIKRVIGLPGDTISSGPNGQILIDGHPISQPWASFSLGTGPAIAPFHVPAGDYFLMGDNRGDSRDSRYFGPIPGKLIIGRAFVRIWPINRIGLL
ncbi:MAG TPA: signal peptidase I [Acidimicrobiales bacterium]|nr:signal peptidase I [Acidimicrobiales bacterium]